MAETVYYAVPDPSDPGRMTYWRSTARGIKPWPAKAKYGPALYRADVPAHLAGQARQEWVADWYREHAHPWWDAIHASIAADPGGCARRFAAFASRCCRCGRELTAADSKTYGIGPECRADTPDWLLAAFAERIGRAHGGGTA